MDKMYMVVQAYHTDEYNDEAPDFMLATMSEAYIFRTLSRMELATKMKSELDDFYSLEFWEYHDWYLYHEELEEYYGDEPVFFNEPLPEIFERASKARVDCSTAVITHDSYYISGFIKYTNRRVTTTPVSKDVLAELV